VDVWHDHRIFARCTTKIDAKLIVDTMNGKPVTNGKAKARPVKKHRRGRS
jgi:hypothetical protein